MSKGKDMKDIDRLDRLDDDLVETILAMSPEEAMEGVNPDDLAAMTANVAAAGAKVGRARLARAKAAAQSDAGRPKPTGSTRSAEALKSIRANDAVFNERLTLAARGGGESYEADRASIEADLEELRQDEERGDRD
ncbi:hypothetical protein [Flavisphingomonas formosensis]|uniref:hypothetical protein n=1 Tax=Flavisphingomonas formosensis TaxID=861534 RepID=UPI0012F79E69|nr:hypothetical protein [Sphingomonas formosensis]